MNVQINLKLLKAYNQIELKYNTFEKVSYDRYFIASLIKHEGNTEKAFKIIDSLTGKGSLNTHYKKIYEEMSKLTTQEIDDILKDSLYPIQKIEYFKYLHIPTLNASYFNKKYFNYNLALDDDFPKQLVGENDTYVSHKYIENEPKENIDVYHVDLNDDEIKIEMFNQYIPIDEKTFNSIIIKEEFDLSQYKGEIFNDISGNRWIQLIQSNYNNILAASHYYYEDGYHFGIYNQYVRRTQLAKKWGIYWIKEKTFHYDRPENKDICEKTVKKLLNTGAINEFKTKSIVRMINGIHRDIQQEVINYILQRKDSKELARIAFTLIDKGIEKGWHDEVVKTLYKHNDHAKDLEAVYIISESRVLEITDLVTIYNRNKRLLNEIDIKKVEAYNEDRKQSINYINQKTGEMMNSSIRENLKKMIATEESKKLKKVLNNIAHMEKDINNKNLSQLKEMQEKVVKGLELYSIVKKQLEEQNND